MNTFQYDGQEKRQSELKLFLYIITVARKDWELPNSRIWLAEIDTE